MHVTVGVSSFLMLAVAGFAFACGISLFSFSHVGQESSCPTSELFMTSEVSYRETWWCVENRVVWADTLKGLFFFFFYPCFLTQPLSSRHCLLSSRAVLWSIGTTDGIQVCLLQQTSDDLSWHQKALAVLVQRNSGCHGYCFGRGITREPALRRAVLSSARLIRM